MAATVSKDDLVTGEAVVVALPYAGLALRAWSGIIDLVTNIVLLVLTAWAFVYLAEGLDDALIMSFSLLISIFWLVAFPSLFESFTGRTVGKRLTGLRTVRSDGAPADPRRIITRHLIGFLELWMSGGALALMAALMTEPTRRLGDIAAGTYVARDRVRLHLPEPSPMPPPLQGWARSADFARLPDDLAAMIRSTLAQSADFSESAGRRVDDMLASRAARYVAPPPPPGTPSRAFLHAIMAERRRRETERLDAAEQRRRRLFETAR